MTSGKRRVAVLRLLFRRRRHPKYAKHKTANMFLVIIRRSVSQHGRPTLKTGKHSALHTMTKHIHIKAA
jgi:hypothetical protein